ncbi:hypothetical protein DFP72DRAFT_930097 [Ephemerocybe angulata]|uniref:Uncharacterized protein n=1 Tax=Ephemerocybe angulata TaxID=980116 RepID=A0A8H6LVX6_9AGAR|nr:hypothetical protein DFP72DRAFT_930097 [Tulosesus angulatus]
MLKPEHTFQNTARIHAQITTGSMAVIYGALDAATGAPFCVLITSCCCFERRFSFVSRKSTMAWNMMVRNVVTRMAQNVKTPSRRAEHMKAPPADTTEAQRDSSIVLGFLGVVASAGRFIWAIAMSAARSNIAPEFVFMVDGGVSLVKGSGKRF